MVALERGLLRGMPGKRVLLLGNEAIARGALEAGVGVVTTYPGTPASEIADSISLVAREAGLYMEYSTNEIVAVETAIGAAFCGVRALSAMKHVGLNVAADALMTIAYSGVRGGLLIVTADDPNCYSSQNEQDNRYYALLSSLPMLEPSDAQEAKDMTLYAFELSERLELPCMLRTTTRVSHTRAPVVLGPLRKPSLRGEFIRDVRRFFVFPAHARPRHKVLLEKAEEARFISEECRFNQAVLEGGEIGVVTSGVAYNYVMEAIELLGLEAGVLKLGMTHPLPRQKLADFMQPYEQIVVVEELEPYLELHLRALAKDDAPHLRIRGKMDAKILPRFGELSTRVVAEALSEISGKALPLSFRQIDEKYAEAAQLLPARPPTLCPGCPHRASFYVIRTATQGKAVCTSDIGCYSLGVQPPQEVGDTLICMGASIGIACGVSKVVEQDVVAVLGDSTFFHAAIPGLINAVYNNHRVVLIVLDNLTTAMTGHQPHPGTGKTGMGFPSKKVLVEEVARGCSVDYVEVVNPFEVKRAIGAVKEALRRRSPSVLIFRAPCTLLVLAEKRRKGEEVVPARITERCTNCAVCVKLTGCPALVAEDERVLINEAFCSGCMLCASVCPYNAIEPISAGGSG